MNFFDVIHDSYDYLCDFVAFRFIILFLMIRDYVIFISFRIIAIVNGRLDAMGKGFD